MHSNTRIILSFIVVQSVLYNSESLILNASLELTNVQKTGVWWFTNSMTKFPVAPSNRLFELLRFKPNWSSHDANLRWYRTIIIYYRIIHWIWSLTQYDENFHWKINRYHHLEVSGQYYSINNQPEWFRARWRYKISILYDSYNRCQYK
jgi:hypothetical protein